MTSLNKNDGQPKPCPYCNGRIPYHDKDCILHHQPVPKILQTPDIKE